ncbi:mucolipin-3-like isoform X2 [Mercenaria mercenaria]|uniref:mucolipin-3-like isoform X2 n=1 Tax=Mercenaria mercenaria TaxID=6596 RepID=UPI00234F6AF1|nr:mucolipin-3-like isoform X2 [Mercenaria mercenaria]
MQQQILESMAANDETLGQEDVSQHGYQTFGNRQQPESSYQQQTGSNSQQTGSSSNPNVTQQPTSRNTQGRGTEPKPGLTRVRSFYTPYMEDKLCRKLKYFFMGPHEKIKAKRKCPWKLLIQILKIALVTAQLIQFGYSRSSLVDFVEKSTITMEHMYLMSWDSTYETLPYPAAIGKYALYTTEDIIKHINFATCKYDQTEIDAIGSLRFYRKNGTVNQMKMCLHKYRSSHINDTTNKYKIDSTVDTNCYSVGKWNESGNDCNDSYDIVQYMKQKYNMTLNSTIFDRLLLAELKFSLKSFRLEMKQRTFPPQLFRVDVTINFDDKNKDGQMLVTLDTDFKELDLDGTSNNDDAQDHEKAGYVVFDCFVLVVTIISMMLCSRSVIRAQQLRRETNAYFKLRRGKSLSRSDQCEFLNLWYVTIIINDLLTIVGTAFKIQLELRNMKSSSSNFDYCGVMLGTGSLLAWLGVLRYIGYFPQFNILIVTLKKAFPNMMRFLVCCIMLYIGFVICGWVVLGPYHIKFRDMSTTSECLFALINGDDIFTTFSATVTENPLVWYYSRIYLYVFISLFTYAVLNLFIAVIMDTYETIKEYYDHGFPKSELFEFIDLCQDPVHSPIYRREDNSCNPLRLCCCCGNDPDRPNEYTSLVQ